MMTRPPSSVRAMAWLSPLLIAAVAYAGPAYAEPPHDLRGAIEGRLAGAAADERTAAHEQLAVTLAALGRCDESKEALGSAASAEARERGEAVWQARCGPCDPHGWRFDPYEGPERIARCAGEQPDALVAWALQSTADVPPRSTVVVRDLVEAGPLESALALLRALAAKAGTADAARGPLNDALDAYQSGGRAAVVALWDRLGETLGPLLDEPHAAALAEVLRSVGRQAEALAVATRPFDWPSLRLRMLRARLSAELEPRDPARPRGAALAILRSALTSIPKGTDPAERALAAAEASLAASVIHEARAARELATRAQAAFDRRGLASEATWNPVRLALYEAWLRLGEAGRAKAVMSTFYNHNYAFSVPGLAEASRIAAANGHLDEAAEWALGLAPANVSSPDTAPLSLLLLDAPAGPPSPLLGAVRSALPAAVASGRDLPPRAALARFAERWLDASDEGAAGEVLALADRASPSANPGWEAIYFVRRARLLRRLGDGAGADAAMRSAVQQAEVGDVTAWLMTVEAAALECRSVEEREAMSRAAADAARR